MSRKLKIALGVFVVCFWVLPVAALAHHLGQGNGSAPAVVDNYAHGVNAQNNQIGEDEGPGNAMVGNGIATATQSSNSGADAGGGDGGAGGGDGGAGGGDGGAGGGNGGAGGGNGGAGGGNGGAGGGNGGAGGGNGGAGGGNGGNGGNGRN